MAVDLNVVRRLVAADHGLAVVAIARADGTVHTSVVNAGVLEDPITGRRVVGFVARADANKLKLLRRQPRLSLVFRASWEWAAVEGTARLVGPDDELPGFDPAGLPRLLRDVFSAAAGKHDDWDEYDRVMAAEGRTAVLVDPARIVSN